MIMMHALGAVSMVAKKQEYSNTEASVSSSLGYLFSSSLVEFNMRDGCLLAMVVTSLVEILRLNESSSPSTHFHFVFDGSDLKNLNQDSVVSHVLLVLVV